MNIIGQLHKTAILIALCTVGILITGCSGNPTKPQPTPQQIAAIAQCKSSLPSNKRIKKESITYGCLATLGFWKAIGQDNPAAMICAAGGGTGFLLGESVAERKCEYLDLASQLDGEIANTSQVNTKFGFFFMEQDMKLKANKSQADALLKQNQQETATRLARQNLHQQLSGELEKENRLLTQLYAEHGFKQQTLNEAKAAQQDQQKTDQLKAEIDSLRKNIKKLRDNNHELEIINASLGVS